MPADRGYERRQRHRHGGRHPPAWPHMREVCGLVATSGCRDELIRQAIRQARRVRLARWCRRRPAAPRSAVRPDRPHPDLKREKQRSDEIAQTARNMVSAWLRKDNRESNAGDALSGALDGEDIFRIVADLLEECANGGQQ